MTIFSLDETVVREAVRSVLPPVPPREESGADERSDECSAECTAECSDDLTVTRADDFPVAREDGDEPPEELEPAVVASRFARAVWSGIAEPSDITAGLLVRALGSAAALTALVERQPGERVCAAVADAGGDPISETEIGLAFERWMPRLASNSALTAMRLSARVGSWLLTPDDPRWPVRLHDLGLHEPLALWVRGAPTSLARVSRSVALVGARASTGYGEHMAMELSAGLSDRRVAIVSGAAYGIDGMAHRVALASDGGFTVALLAGGVDRCYPSGHDVLLGRIANLGLLISELPCGSPPTKWRFLQRNRLISAVSAGTVVVEAGIRSGSLNTAAHAATIGRPLGAVPGPVTSLSSAGCHRLLREFDATCVTSADDVVEMIGSDSGFARTPDTGKTAAATAATPAASARAAGDEPRRAPEQVRLLDAVSQRSFRTTADIASRAGLSISDAQSLLGMLHLDGEIVERDGGWVRTAARQRR